MNVLTLLYTVIKTKQAGRNAIPSISEEQCNGLLIRLKKIILTITEVFGSLLQMYCIYMCDVNFLSHFW